jgi:hypothetical protein
MRHSHRWPILDCLQACSSLVALHLPVQPVRTMHGYVIRTSAAANSQRFIDPVAYDWTVQVC